MAALILRRLALAGMVALLVGAVPLAQTPEPAQDDSIEAVRRRANAGDAQAQVNLGAIYAYGLGAPQDDFEAYKWLNLATTYAVESIREELAEMRDTVAERLTPEQHTEGQRRSRKWFAAHPREP